MKSDSILYGFHQHYCTVLRTHSKMCIYPVYTQTFLGLDICVAISSLNFKCFFFIKGKNISHPDGVQKTSNHYSPLFHIIVWRA